jgi:hydroxymethylglutaryl-CoA lyase
MSHIDVIEVGARDGLQNEERTLSLEARFAFIKHLAESGLKRIEAGAFVSPQWVPQMAGSRELILELFARKDEFPKGVRFSALVPNVRGMTDALTTPIPEIAIFGACSESFSKKNINCTIDESLERFREVTSIARKNKRKVRGYLSVAFGCPYEGPVPEARVIALVQKFIKLGVYEISIGDTIGVANPKQVRGFLTKLKSKVALKNIALHMHDTRGTALANVLAGLECGVRAFDSSFGGLGGCPYAAGASGNLATDDLVYMLHGMGFKTGVDLSKLLAYGPVIQNEIGHKLPSRTAEAGLPKVLGSINQATRGKDQ